MVREQKTIASDLTFTEAPRWHDGRLWFSDFYTSRVFSVAEDGSDLKVELELPGQPSGLGWLPDGRLLVVSMRDAKIFRREPSGAIATHADLKAHVRGLLNDMVVDASGRAYAGSFGFDLAGGERIETTSLAIVGPDGAVSMGGGDLWFPNGCIITPDGKTLLVAETMGNRISAFDINPQDGSLSDRRDWATFGNLPTSRIYAELKQEALPDGCCLDAEGCVWVADAGGKRILRVREGGEVVEQIDTGTGAFACMLGGADGRTLFACLAPDHNRDNRLKANEATIVAMRVEVPGAGLP
ncbi:gluconolactonase [Thozetella sp. PMI_491]|nr:gluconolactonase [Thozetella sp. PMI_491]